MAAAQRSSSPRQAVMVSGPVESAGTPQRRSTSDTARPHSQRAQALRPGKTFRSPLPPTPLLRAPGGHTSFMRTSRSEWKSTKVEETKMRTAAAASPSTSTPPTLAELSKQQKGIIRGFLMRSASPL